MVIDYLIAGAVMVTTVVVTTVLCSRAEYDGPDEPWANWEGDIPPEMIDGAPNRPAGRALGYDLGPGETQTWGVGWPE